MVGISGKIINIYKIVTLYYNTNRFLLLVLITEEIIKSLHKDTASIVN